MRRKFYTMSKILLCILIAINVIAILTTIIFTVSSEMSKIVAFDMFVCLAVFADFLSGYFASTNRTIYIEKNWITLFACIPFDLLLSPFLPSDILVYLKLFRGLLLIMVLFRIVGEFLKSSRLDEILGVLVVIVIGSTVGLYLIDPSINSLFDSLWFVVVSITTVGYGDITPNTVYGKVFSLILLVLGVFIFSAITGAISSYFMDNVLQEGTYHIHDLRDKVEKSEAELEKVNNQLKESDKKIDELKEEILELKKIIEKNN